MKKFVIVCTVACLAAFSAAALDVGGYITNDTRLMQRPPAERVENGERIVGDRTREMLDQRNSLTLWARHPFFADGSFYLASELYYQFEWNDDFSDQLAAGQKHVLDITLLKLGYTRKINSSRSLGFSIGRFGFSDLTGIIYRQPADGFLFDFQSPRIKTSVYGGYTGFLNSLNVSILDFRRGSSAFAHRNNDWYDLAVPYVVFDGMVSLPYFLFNQTFSAEVLSVVGLSARNGTRINSSLDSTRMYFSAALNGPLASKLFYTLSSTFVGYKDETSQDDGPMSFGNLSQLTLNFYPGILSSAITLNGVYASGNNGWLRPFVGFTKNTALFSSDEKQFTDMLKAGVGLSVKPLAQIYLSGNFDMVWACPNNVRYDGMQWSAMARLQPFPDLMLAAEVRQFIGAREMVDDGLRANVDKLELSIRAGLSF